MIGAGIYDNKTNEGQIMEHHLFTNNEEILDKKLKNKCCLTQKTELNERSCTYVC